MNSKEIQPYIYTYSISPKLPSYPGCHIILSRVPVLYVRTRPPFWTCTLSLRFIVHPDSHSYADCWPEAFNSLIASDSPQDQTFNVPSGNRRRKRQPTPVFLPGESQGWRSLVGFVYGVAQSWTRLKSLSGSSSSFSRHGKMQESGFLISFLSHPSQLSGPSIIVFRIPSYSELTVGSGCNLMATRCQVFFSLSALRTQELTSEG